MRKSTFLWFLVVLVGLLVYGFLNPEHYFFPKCPFLSVTGWKCPGCGSQRAVHQLLHGNVGASFTYNPLFIPGLLYALVGYFIALFLPKVWLKVRLSWFGKRAAYIALIAILLFWVGRNVL